MEGFARIRQGEKLPMGVRTTALSGTLIVQPTPTPTCTLYDAAGSPVDGRNQTVADGFDNGPLGSPRVWHNLDTLAPAPLEEGFYTLVFRFCATGSDGIPRTYVPALIVQVTEF